LGPDIYARWPFRARKSLNPSRGRPVARQVEYASPRSSNMLERLERDDDIDRAAGKRNAARIAGNIVQVWLGIQSAEAAIHRRIVPAISLAAHRSDDCDGLQDVAVVAGVVIEGAVMKAAPATI